MVDIRKASLESHAAACAAGRAVAIAHVPSHSIGAANYALQLSIEPPILLMPILL